MSLNLDKLNLDKLQTDTAEVLVEGLEFLVEGAAEDIRAFASAISRDLWEAQLTEQTDLLEMLTSQLVVLGEINRVRAVRTRWVVVSSVTKAIFKAVLAGVVSAVL